MFILSILIIEILFALSLIVELAFCYDRIDYRFDKFHIGFYPKVYQRRYKNIGFSLGLIPLAFSFNLKSHSLEKSKKLKYQQMVIPYLSFLLLHSTITIFILGTKQCYLFYKSLLLFNSDYFVAPYMADILSLMESRSLGFFALSTISSAIVLFFYFIVLKNALTPVLSLTLGMIGVPAHNLFAILITYATIIYLFIKSGAKELFLILKYDFVSFWLVDIFIAQCLFIVGLALVLEILSRRETSKNPS